MQETGFQDTPAFTECKFTCASGKCLSLGSLVCNQQDDCGDNSDEGGCQLVTERPPPRTFNPELASAQATAIAAVVTVMVVVVVCLLSHYRVSTRSFLSRPSPGRTQEHGLPPEGCLWPSGSSVVQPGASEVMCAPRARDRFIQSERLCRFQPTYPYEGHVDLPPTISLSDGEEPPPYQGPRALQLRDPGQQRELSRESVRAPPNRTVFDSDLVEVSVHGRGPGPPSSKAGISATATATACSGPGAEGPPPTYSEVVGPGPPCLPDPHGSTPRGAPGRTGVPAKGKDRNPGPLA